MNWPGGAALYFSHKFHHWLMLHTLGQYIVNVQWSTTGDRFLTIFTFGIRIEINVETVVVTNRKYNTPPVIFRTLHRSTSIGVPNPFKSYHENEDDKWCVAIGLYIVNLHCTERVEVNGESSISRSIHSIESFNTLKRALSWYVSLTLLINMNWVTRVIMYCFVIFVSMVSYRPPNYNVHNTIIRRSKPSLPFWNMIPDAPSEHTLY